MANNDLLSVSDILDDQNRKIAKFDEKLELLRQNVDGQILRLKHTVEANNKNIFSRMDRIAEAIENLHISPPAAVVEEESQGSLNPAFEGDGEEGGENGELCDSLFITI